MPEPKGTPSKNYFYYIQRFLAQSAPAASASYTLIGGVTLFCIFGYYLDSRYDTLPWFTLFGLIIGLVIGIVTTDVTPPAKAALLKVLKFSLYS